MERDTIAREVDREMGNDTYAIRTRYVWSSWEFFATSCNVQIIFFRRSTRHSFTRVSENPMMKIFLIVFPFTWHFNYRSSHVPLCRPSINYQYFGKLFMHATYARDARWNRWLSLVALSRAHNTFLRLLFLQCLSSCTGALLRTRYKSNTRKVIVTSILMRIEIIPRRYLGGLL